MDPLDRINFPGHRRVQLYIKSVLSVVQATIEENIRGMVPSLRGRRNINLAAYTYVGNIVKIAYLKQNTTRNIAISFFDN